MRRPRTAQSGSLPLTLGVEEELFLLEKGRLEPTLQSLDYMRRLLWSNPRRYSRHTASNFSRGKDARICLMSSVEIATGVHASLEELLEDLRQCRQDMLRASRGALAVPVGSLFTLESPSNTAGLHIHIGVPVEERDRVYNNIAAFLPVLAVASACSPFAGGRYFGLSYRMAQAYAQGPLREDREHRFQDLIISKRLGTIEVRLLDPIPEMDRMREVLQALIALAQHPQRLPFDREEYNAMRPSWTQQGLTPWVRALHERLQAVYPFPIELLEHTLSSRLREVACEESFLCAYREANRLWRHASETSSVTRRYSGIRTLIGVAGFYAPRLPYMAYKGFREWHGEPPR
jgi:gamma-glutamyl:cysteine ligase YbdK (ATP-grasp superfamily)